MDLAKFKWLVECGRLLMPAATKFTDKLEGTAPAGEAERWRQAFAQAGSERERAAAEHNSAFMGRMRPAFLERYYVSCWNFGDGEQREMWETYTSGPTAVMIETSYAVLRRLLPCHVEMGLVRYIDYGRDDVPSLNVFEYITHKDLSFSFEREVRAVAFHNPVAELGGKAFETDHFEAEADPTFRVYAPPIDVKALIRRVVLHPDAPPEFETEITDLCTRFGLPAPQRSALAGREILVPETTGTEDPDPTSQHPNN
jgi:hypothetical protein